MLLEDDSSHAAIEADIRDDLAKIGITVTARPVDKDTFNTDMVAGNYDMVFSKTWGAPYDPHSYVNSWTTTDEGFYSALPTADIDRAAFEAQVDAALSEMDPAQRQAKWTAILKSVHDEVVALPLYGVRLPHITRRSRLSGYAPGTQNYDYPLHKALVVDSDKTVKVSIEGTGGNFTTAGGLEPHATFPMQFFSNNWIYEGLVRYGAGGAVEPALATEWASTVNSDGSETVRFMAQPGRWILLRYADVDVVPKPQEASNYANRPVLVELNSLFLPGMRLVDRIFNWIQLPRSTLCDLILAPPAVLVEIWFVTSSLDQQCQLIDHHARPTT